MLIVFDLDFTLWDAGGTWCDHTHPPYRHDAGNILDSHERRIYLFPDVREILEHFFGMEIPMAIASRTHSPEAARKLMHMFEIRKYFQFEEIYPGSKRQHFENLRRITRIPYREMYFFDDEYRNIQDTLGIGVNAYQVNSGLSWQELQELPITNY